ncbi:MAG TPA: hypothetical protein RMH85_36015 [Polyangiaceae bacterium LLY-WYZ-15_(1-7)]|nr:hypothetical protein [Sandaracinus sp.]MBJ74873.1 hypothetical protein [Sandaracinus sp.]HJK93792.1 hypothetical protein [Polyangiaceae bacterium LLY-WYZ-15_(1-7)]HJL03389.1 hypothetical protein [Polyangiaceae bacterium LLY-WYZ-15_(1-7)]HJL13948.1 hypothetical protein [Polyangiaceae bacterium LLY-WYZ-15_(1-7)]
MKRTRQRILRPRLLQRSATFVALLLGLLGAAGCEDPVVVGPQPPQAGPTTPAPPPGPAPAPAAPVELETDAGTPDSGLSYEDDDFVEVDTENRDPFRSFASVFRQRTVAAPQRTVIMPTTSIDEMRLIAIISGVAQPRAMLLDGNRVGHVVKRGDYIGRPEVIQAGGADSMPVTLNWRVARIRAGEVVLTREDPTAPDRPPLSRTLPLYEEGEDPLELRRRALARELEERGEDERTVAPAPAPTREPVNLNIQIEPNSGNVSTM